MTTFPKTVSTVSKAVASVASNNKVAFTAIGVKIVWAIAYYVSIQSKAYFCAPWTWYGIFIAPFISETPICSGLNWVEQASRQVIREMWSILGLWVVYVVFSFKNRTGGNPEPPKPPPNTPITPRSDVPPPLHTPISESSESPYTLNPRDLFTELATSDDEASSS